jgi:hypothetical protein
MNPMEMTRLIAMPIARPMAVLVAMPVPVPLAAESFYSG